MQQNIWVSKTFSENVGHVEVLLDNFIHHRLAKDRGQDDSSRD